MPDLEHDSAPLGANEIERIILDTEPESMSAKGDKVWTRRMAEALASRLALRSQTPEPSSSEVRMKGQRTICEACGNINLLSSKAVWTDDGTAFCPSCAPTLSPTVSQPIEAQPIHALPMPKYDFQGNEPTPSQPGTGEEVERLTRERDAAILRAAEQEDRADSAEARLSAVEVALEKAIEALKPFAEAGEVFAREYPAMLDKPATSCGIRFDALKDAREVLTTITGGEKPSGNNLRGVTGEVEELIAWLEDRAHPDSGLDYGDDSRGIAYATVHGYDAAFVAEHFHGKGAAHLASLLRAALSAQERG